MQCPYCKHAETKVVDSRTSQDLTVRRRRKCENCQRRFTTHERIEEFPLKVVKRNGTLAKFDRSKILNGLLIACSKRPVSGEQLEEIVGHVEYELLNNFSTEVPSEVIGRMTQELLRDLDDVAYVRFRSVFGDFCNLNDFASEVVPMLKSESSYDY